MIFEEILKYTRYILQFKVRYNLIITLFQYFLNLPRFNLFLGMEVIGQ